jgi:predicted RNA-binding protein
MMCESNAYMLKDGKEELLLSEVARIDPMEDGGFKLSGLFGEEVSVKGRIETVNLLAHKIIFVDD